jgi:hypothetical protein
MRFSNGYSGTSKQRLYICLRVVYPSTKRDYASPKLSSSPKLSFLGKKVRFHIRLSDQFFLIFASEP